MMTKEKAEYYSEVLKAFSEGKQIQVRAKDEAGEVGKWVDLDSNCAEFYIHSATFEYRIKPEATYRPYANAEEFLAAQKEHGLYLRNKCGHYELPTFIGANSIFFEKNQILYKNLLYSYSWQDGFPCGILEKE